MHIKDLLKYDFYLFDCDGVVLDSNKIKSDSFRELFNKYPKNTVESFIKYHQINNGISRFIKIKKFYEEFLNFKISNEELNNTINDYGNIVYDKLCLSHFVDGVFQLLIKLRENKKKIFIISGSYEEELINVFIKKNIYNLFDEICGSPRDKNLIFKYLKKKYKINTSRCIYFGDSIIDYSIAEKHKIPFVHVRRHTEIPFENNNGSKYINDFNDLNYE
tara:strand:- start:192 stop:848 length:657 start_codon:yes stop_codon:yes gene_type:complete